jgi:hypothetical protein
MTLEEASGEDDVEAADEDDDPSPPTQHAPRRVPVGRLSGDMKEHQLQAIVGVGKNKYPQKPYRLCAAHKKLKDTRCICGIHKVPLHKRDCFTRYHTRMKVSFYIYYYDICSRVVIIHVYTKVCIFNNTGKLIRSTGG